MPVRCALLSVSNKIGLLPLAQALSERGVVLVSTGGTFQALQDAGLSVESIETYTQSPEVMDGRVKTLHPRVHGGILAREGVHDADLAKIGARFIDLVVVNLYPFEQTLRNPESSFEQLIENIDIGGPSMLRSAAKNHERVAVVCDPTDYSAVIDELTEFGEITSRTRRRLAAKAFAHTAHYDVAISGWLSGQAESKDYPERLTLCFEKAYGLRYGENPHQSAAFYRELGGKIGSLANAESLGAGAKELSFNNLVDSNAALDAVREFEHPAAVIVKHATPCGVASHFGLPEAYRAARAADALSAFGGIVALNREVCQRTAALLAETFLECIIAPSFTAEALQILRAKPALRILATGSFAAMDEPNPDLKRIGGGLLVQQLDELSAEELSSAKVVTERGVSEAETAALSFAWRVCKHVKSNAIVLATATEDAQGCATIGIGSGQTSRVDAVEIACRKAGERAKGGVLASDAFFPFPDSIERAAQAGIAAVIQPGGSKRDADVIAAANEAKIAMLLTGRRHFKH